jgi:hypothetical protein
VGTEYVLKQLEWIPVSERLPELEEDVLLLDDWETIGKERKQDIRVGYLYSTTAYKTSSGVNNDCEWRGTEYAFNITHWLPLSVLPVPKTK